MINFKNVEERRAWHRNRYHKRRATILEILGNKCNNCNAKNDLEIDHIDPKNKSFHVGNEWSKPWLEIVKEIGKCQLLCNLCHRAKHTTRMHGTITMHRHGNCRCILCVQAYNKYQREWKAKNRAKKKNIAPIA